MKISRKLTALALGFLTSVGMSSMAIAACDPLPGTTIGDVNGDGAMDVLDVVNVVGVAFRNNAPSRFLGSDDLNGDGISSDVLDVVGIVGQAFRNIPPIFPYRVYSLKIGTAAGTSTLIDDDSIQYLIQGVYSVGSDSVGSNPPAPESNCIKTDTLRIEVGTTIWGDTGAVVSAVIVRRHGYIISVGTEADPIVMTSRLAPGTRNRGNWGGLVINGCDSCNEPSGQFLSEGNGGIGGGFMSGDNSGCVIYTREEFSGHVFTLGNELNGITLNGVGRGTTMNHIQINQNADDGFEWFGGTVCLDHCVVSGCDDDKYDTDLGCNFFSQFLLAVEDTTKGSSSDNEGFEADNRPASPYNSLPRSTPRFANCTEIGQGYDYPTTSMGIHVRRGTQGEWYNILWVRERRALDCDDRTGTDSTMQIGTSGIYNSIWYDVGAFNNDGDGFGNEFNNPGAPFFNSFTVNAFAPAPGLPMPNILVGPTGYTDPGFTTGTNDFRPIPGSLPTTWLTVSGTTVTLPAGFNASGNGYIGAVDPNAATEWYDGWTNWAQF